jgi:hypothetical protein
MAQQQRVTGAGQSGPPIPILDWDPDLAEDLAEDQLGLARRQVVAEVIAYPARVVAGRSG